MHTGRRRPHISVAGVDTAHRGSEPNRRTEIGDQLLARLPEWGVEQVIGAEYAIYDLAQQSHV